MKTLTEATIAEILAELTSRGYPLSLFTVQSTHGNDYHCGCCRMTWDDENEFDTVEEAIAFIAKSSNKIYDDRVQECDYSYSLESMNKDVTSDFQTEISAAIAAYKKELEDKLHAKLKEEDRRRKIANLKKKIEATESTPMENLRKELAELEAEDTIVTALKNSLNPGKSQETPPPMPDSLKKP